MIISAHRATGIHPSVLEPVSYSLRNLIAKTAIPMIITSTAGEVPADAGVCVGIWFVGVRGDVRSDVIVRVGVDFRVGGCEGERRICSITSFLRVAIFSLPDNPEEIISRAEVLLPSFFINEAT